MWVIPALQAVPVPADLPAEQVASFFVNPATALAMTRCVLKVPRGVWLLCKLLPAAPWAAWSSAWASITDSAPSTSFAEREQARELQLLGGDALVCTADESIENRVAALTENRGVPFALDAVGGAVGMAVVPLRLGGRMLVYGILSGEPVPLDGLALIVGQKAVEGFLLSDWARRQSPLAMLLLFRRISRLLRTGVLATEVGGFLSAGANPGSGATGGGSGPAGESPAANQVAPDGQPASFGLAGRSAPAATAPTPARPFPAIRWRR